MSLSSSHGKDNEELIILTGKFKEMSKTYKTDSFNESSFFQIYLSIYKYLLDSVKSNYSVLIKERWPQSLVDILKKLLEHNDWNLLSLINNYLINITDKSEKVCAALTEGGIAEVLIDIYIKAYSIEFSFQNIVLTDVLTIIHNISRHVGLQQNFHQHEQIDKFKQIIKPLSFDVDEKMSILSTFVLTWLFKENQEEKKNVDEHCGIIKNVFKYISLALKYPNRTYEGWSIWELLLGLQALSSISATGNVITIMEEFLPILICIITDKSSSQKEVELSLGILWNFSFSESNSELLKTKYDIVKILEPFSQSNIKPIKRNTKGLMWCLNSKPDTDSNVFKYDIFLSYNHEQKESIVKVVKKLKEKYTVWIDWDNIKGSGLDDMALGIERSRLFVMCVSNSYKQSQNCRAEASYAFRIKRPIIPLLMEYKYKPDGWLGIISSSELYIDFSKFAKQNETIPLLMSTINHKMKTYKVTPTITKTSSKELLEKSKTIKKEQNEIKTIKKERKEQNEKNKLKDWSQSQVSQWLSSNDLGHIKSKFDEFDGKMINEIIKMRIDAPQIYYKTLEKKMKLTFPEILQLSSALTNLKP